MQWLLRALILTDSTVLCPLPISTAELVVYLLLHSADFITSASPEILQDVNEVLDEHHFFFFSPSGMHSRYDTTAKHSSASGRHFFFPANFNSIALVFQTISIEHIVQVKCFVLPPSWTVTDGHRVVMSAAAAGKQRTIAQ